MCEEQAERAEEAQAKQQSREAAARARSWRGDQEQQPSWKKVLKQQALFTSHDKLLLQARQIHIITFVC
jgi:hypothetical protein